MPARPRGFTLIELVIIIVILGILATQAIPTYLSMVDDARKAAARSNLGSLRSALSVYYAYKATPMGGESAIWPTISQLTDQATVLNGQMPDNPYDRDPLKNNVVYGVNVVRGTIIGPTGGWAYTNTTGLIWLHTSTAGISENGW